MMFTLFMHYIAFVLYIFVLTCSLPLVLFFFSLSILLCVFGLYSSTMPRKTRANRVPLLLLYLPLGVSFLRTTVVVRHLRN